MAIPIGNGNHQVNDGISPISSGDIMRIQREYQENIMGTWWVYSGVWWYVPFCYSRVCNGSHTPCIDDLWLFPFSSFNGYFPVPLHQITRRVTYSRYNQWRSTLRIDWIPWSKFQVFRAQLNASSRWAKLVPMRCRIQISKQVVKLNLNFILIQTPVLFYLSVESQVASNIWGTEGCRRLISCMFGYEPVPGKSSQWPFHIWM